MYESKSEIIEDNLKLTYDNIKQYSNILFSNKYQNIIFPYINIRILRNSFMKICSLAELYPEEVTRFTFYKQTHNKINISLYKNEESNISLTSDLSTLVETSPPFPILATAFVEIPAFSIKSFFIIFLSINNFQSLS